MFRGDVIPGAPSGAPAWAPPRQGPNPAGAIIGAVVAIIVAVVVLVSFFGFLSPFGAPFGFMVVPIIGFLLVIVFIIIAVAVSMGGFGRPSLPPPPPVQQPMVPAGMEGPIALNCPNCGAPPESIDRFGVAICTHCATRFLVR